MPFIQKTAKITAPNMHQQKVIGAYPQTWCRVWPQPEHVVPCGAPQHRPCMHPGWWWYPRMARSCAHTWAHAGAHVPGWHGQGTGPASHQPANMEQLNKSVAITTACTCKPEQSLDCLLAWSPAISLEVVRSAVPCHARGHCL